ncbi:unnamed protein product [Musa acuminata subsp. malaccensis]|uniref:(wild Malaysian banana) hypothetical protein n=1 Tax=Musa acuminata subsp. malaccensis TaxID=214687 RepID=A0A804KBD6_MUSAM|nr:PREDICTED: protein IQ-DOMAIN 14-like [Musa acuminata subsp. malaccensis]CAG1832908.1 unnamed protein product [Musa acuminata subsp. malaccensis]
MWKTGKWLRSFLTGKKDGKKEKAESFSSPLPINSQSSPISVPAPKEKRRWRYPRWAGAGKSLSSQELSTSVPPLQRLSEVAIDNKRHAMAVAVATAAAADAAVAVAQAAAAVVRLTTAATKQKASAVKEDAATKIQSAFRAYLARKALCALRGLVKLQALVRGHLVRKQAAATLRCMQALVIAQERARARRIRMAEESQVIPQWQSIHRRSPQHPQSRQSHDMDRNSNKNIEIVDLDLGGSRGSIKSRKSYSTTKTETNEQQFSGYYDQNFSPSNVDQNQQFSPAPSAFTEMSGRAYSGHFEDFTFITAQSSPQYLSAIPVPDPTHSYGHPFFPNYMANTESSRAKARSQSAPRQRTDTFERQTSRRRLSTEGRNIPRVVKMQRSSSHVGLIIDGYQYPLSFKLDRSSMSLKDSECGSTSTVLTNTNYCS